MVNEKRLIDANELKKNYTYLWDEALGTCECVLVEDIEAAPTVDAVEVVHGHWGKTAVKAGDPYDGNSVFCFDVFQCSECGECFDVSDAFNYCPNCGAKMDGDGNGNQT